MLLVGLRCRLLRVVPVVGLSGALLACGAEQAERRAARPSLLEPVTVEDAVPSPATWRYHPRSAARVRARRTLEGGAVLHAGERGERWLVEPGSAVAQGAGRLAPESLVAILRPGGGRWIFVGESGTAYEAESPLGVFVRSAAPLDPLSRVTAARGAILGIRRDGALLRSEGEGAWKRVGPEGAPFADALLTESGHGLALRLPEELWWTEDEGARWRRLEVPTVGAVGFTPGEQDVVVETVLGPRRWSGAEPAVLGRDGEGARRGEPALTIEVPLGPDAGAIREGRAAVARGRYYEVRPAEGKGRGFRLLRGAVDGALEVVEPEAAPACREARLAAFDRMLALACAPEAARRGQQEVEVLRSEDGGKTWEESITVHAHLDELRLAAGRDGALLMSGVCPPGAAEAGCEATGVVILRAATGDGGGRWELAPAATPSLSGTAEALLFSADGATAYAFGRRTKGQSVAVFVSRDGGRTFLPREVAGLTVAEDRRTNRRGEALGVESAAAAEDGSVAFVVRRHERRVLLVTNEDGRVTAMASPPTSEAGVGAAGTRALAVAFGSREAWESLDGGASWTSIGRVPVDPCSDGGQCAEQIQCHPGGCVVGDRVSRLGWRGQADDDAAVLPPPEEAPLVEVRVRTPIACSLDASEWQLLPPGVSVPTADQAAIGKASFFVLREDRDRASVEVLYGRGGARPRVETVALLAPARRPEEVAVASSLQVEGAAALRYAVPGSRANPGAHLRDVEVVWENFLEGTSGRARLPDGGASLPGDFMRDGGGAQRARPSLISIGVGGIYVRPHHSPGDVQPTYFLDGRTVERVPPVRWPEALRSDSRSEMARVGGEHVPLRFVGAGTAVRARREGAGWAFEAMTAGYPEPSRAGVRQHRDIAYVDGRSGWHLVADDGARAMGWVFPFRSSGAVLEAPTRVPVQLDAGDPPRRCGLEERSGTPRVVVPYQGGTRHPVIVADAVEPLRVLLTSGAVLHGKPEAACVAAFDAEVVSHEGSSRTQHERAILPLADLERSWLFRVVRVQGEARLEHRRMSCRFDPAAEVPVEVFKVKGTTVERR